MLRLGFVRAPREPVGRGRLAVYILQSREGVLAPIV